MLLVLFLCTALLSSVEMQGDGAGGWSEWTKWTSCTSSCEGGLQTRIRLCNNPFPTNITDVASWCAGDMKRAIKEEENTKCNNDIPCPRNCTDVQGEDKCKLLVKSFDVCTAAKYHQLKHMCRKTCGWCGTWGSWGSYSSCTVSCDKGGTRTRRRTCDAYDDAIVEDSGQQKCLTDDGALDYGEEGISLCSNMPNCPKLCNDTQQEETCQMWKGKGFCLPGNKYYTTMKTQCRKTCNLCATCVDTRPSEECKAWQDKDYCSPDHQYFKVMATFCRQTCNMCGNWGSWSPYSECSVSCGANGRRSRIRKCFAIDAHSDAPNCLTTDRKLSGDETEISICGHLNACPVDGVWSEWGNWKCSKLCEAGEARRSRTCSNPSPSLGGKPCAGDEEQTQSCYVCPGTWGGWSQWAGCDCTTTTVDQRVRNCLTRNGQAPSSGCLLKTGVQGASETTFQNCTQCPGVVTSQSSSEKPQTHIIGAAAGGVVLLLLVIVLIVYLKKRNKAPEKKIALLTVSEKENGMKDGRLPGEGAETSMLMMASHEEKNYMST